VIPAKHSRTARRRRSLKNADWEVDFFFIVEPGYRPSKMGARLSRLFLETSLRYAIEFSTFAGQCSRSENLSQAIEALHVLLKANAAADNCRTARC
jgi:hypothetical protein